MESISVTTNSSNTNASSVMVSKPEHHGTGRYKVTDYLITTKFSNNVEALVRRDYDDFVWLQNQLLEERAGVIIPMIPPKPEKTVPNYNKIKFSNDFVKERTSVLDRFLQRILQHSELISSPSLYPFFTLNPNDWKTLKKKAPTLESQESGGGAGGAMDDASMTDSFGDMNMGVDGNSILIQSEAAVAQPSKPKGRIGKWFSNKKDQWALRNKNLILEETPADAKKFQDISEYAEHLDGCCKALAENTSQLLISMENAMSGYSIMGTTFSKLWGEHELSNTASSTMYQTVGDVWKNQLAVYSEQQYQMTHDQLELPLQELVLDISSLKAALHKRKQVLYHYTRKVQDGRRLQKELEKLKAVDDLSAHQDKYFQLEATIRTNDAEENKLKVSCSNISIRLSNDIDRFRVEFHERMRIVLATFHQSQHSFLQQQVVSYKSLLPKLQTEMDANRANIPQQPEAVVNPELQVSVSLMGAKASFVDNDGDSEAGSGDPKLLSV